MSGFHSQVLFLGQARWLRVLKLARVETSSFLLFVPTLRSIPHSSLTRLTLQQRALIFHSGAFF